MPHAAPAGRRLALRPSGLAERVARAAQDDGDEDSHRFCGQLRDWLNEAGVNSESQAEYACRRHLPPAAACAHARCRCVRSEDVTADDIQIQSDRLALSELAAERYATAVRRPPAAPAPAACRSR